MQQLQTFLEQNAQMKKLLLPLFLSVFSFAGIAQWTQIGPTVATLSQHSTIVVDGSTPYVAYSDVLSSNKLNVKEYNGTNWVLVGSANISSGAASIPTLAFDNSGTLHVAYIDGGTNINVKEFNGSNWVSVGSANFASGTSLSMAFEGNTPYVAFSEVSGGKMSVMEFDGSSWVYFGTSAFSSSGTDYASLAFDGTQPYVGFQDFGTSGNGASVMTYTGTMWDTVGLTGFSAGSAQYISLALDGSTPYVAFKDDGNGGKATVMKYNGSSWVNEGPAGFSPGIAQYTSLAFHNGDPYVAYTDDNNSDKTRVDYYNGTSWIQLGGSLGVGFTNFSTLTIPGNTAYVVYVDGLSSNGVIAEEYTLAASMCSINASGLSNVLCNDNGTPSDPTDDYITFDLNPTGTDIGTTYTVTGATLTPSGGNYGSVTSFQTNPGTAGGGNLLLTIVDGSDPFCTFAFTVSDPGTCSPNCEITGSGINNIQCNNNGTPSDPTDDYITFDLDPTGNNLGTNYTVSGTNLTPSGGNYGAPTSFQTDPGTAGGGNISLTITDGNDSGCTLTFTLNDPGSCSTTCNISGAGLSNIQCNNNGTPSNPTDDYVTFELNPTGTNLGAGYTVSVPGINLTPSSGTYGSATLFTTDPGVAGSGSFVVTIEDNDDSSCTFSVTVNDPGSCSPNCEITSSGLANVMCNDNSTPTDPTDDYITFDLNPDGFNLGSNYTVSGTNLTPSGGNYGFTTSFQTDPGTAGAGNLSLTITDGANSGCTLTFTVIDPGTCSDQCLIANAGLSNVQCNDNSTSDDPSDDYITFELNPTGNGLMTGYTVTGNNFTPAGGNYGFSTFFLADPGSAGSGHLNLTITDDDDSNCSLAVTVTDPGSCSPDCGISSAGLTNVQCNDNGTPSDPADDYITFDLNPIGNNLGMNYTVTGANLTPSGGNYGSVTSFQTDPGTAGGGNLNLTITDGDDSGCTLSFTVTDPGTCSDECEITASGLANIQCNNNGTPSDPSDDYITFDLDPTGLNLSFTYNVTGTNLTPSNGFYGSVTSFQTDPGTAGAGNLNLTITDGSDSGCTFAFTVTDPGTCSSDCGLTSAGLSNIQCNDNGTPSNPNDDYITFDLNPTGNNLGTSYTVSGTNLTPTGGNYGSTTSFQTDPGIAGAGDLNLTITDDSDVNCTLSFTVTDPGSCSPNCEILTSGLANILCNDNGTPSNPNDDYITFELDPTGFNLGANYTVTGTSLSPTSGNYGSVTTFQTDPGTAGAGNLSLTIVDGNDSGCTFPITISDPGTCSPNCEITATGLTNIQCVDNGTPSDPSDDYITFDLNPTGFNLGASYSVSGANLNPTGGSYGFTTSFQTDPGTAGAGDLNLTLTDSDDSGCTLSFTLSDPGSCSNNCILITSGLSNILCNDNGTPSDPSDDYITFDLDPTGNNLGASYMVSGANLSPNSGNYGSATSFQTDPGTAGAGDLNLTITDDNNSSCTLAVTVTDPGTCSNACGIVSAGLSNIICNNNGTPSDPSDDYFTFDLDPTGNNLGAGYTVSGANLTPTGGNYGAAITFQTDPGTAGAGDLNLTITDDSDANCTFSFTVTDPGSCSTNCNISTSGLSNILCNDNGTPSDPADDYITFDLNPTGNNLGAGYTVSGANLTPSGGNYGGNTSFQTDPGTAGAGDLNLTITDDSDNNCTLSFTVTDPGTCSNTCGIISAGLSNIICNDNGSPDDPSDDYILFDLNPTGNNLGLSYTVSGTNVSPSIGAYGGNTTFQTDPGTAGAGDLNLTITDDSDANCTLNFTVTDPGSCSTTCSLISAGLSNILCNDNGTPSDPSDDYITFDLDPTGNNLGISYTVSGTNLTPSGGNYGGATSFQTDPGTAGAGDLNLTITDDSDGNCTLNVIVTDPGTCSNTCNLASAGLSNILCNDNGTPSDPSDDYITFELDPTGNNLGSSYTVSGAILTPSGGNYGGATSFQTDPGTAGAGDLNLTITDDSDASCTLSVTVADPGSCSTTCGLISAGLSNILCNDNGTPSDPSDDYITFELNPTGNNLGSSYTVSGANLTPSGGNYGVATSFQTDPGTAGAGDLNLTITDDSDANCTLNVTVTDPGTCSNTCGLNSAGLSNILCNDNGTPSDPTDDYITFDLDPTGNNLGASYTLSGANLSPTGGNYGGATSFQTDPGTAGAGDLNLTITDDSDANCTLSFTVSDPGSCSPTCGLVSTGLANILCNDNGTPSDPSDDYITFDLDPTGNNLGTSYTVSGANLTPSSGNYGSATSFQTDPGTAGAGNLNLIITDGDDSNCTLSFTVNDPGTCSNTCSIQNAGLNNILCNDNGTPSDPSDDYITFELDPTGFNLGASYTVSGTNLTPSGGNYGGATTFQTDPGTAGAGNLNLTITDDSDANCTLSVTVNDPGSCSTTCGLVSSGLTNILCNDNGTPSDPSDDYITFDLDPTGNNLGTSYTVTGTNLTPNGGNYGGITSFQTDPGTAGGGNLNLTIIDDSDANCTFSFSVTDPGTCSNTCGLTAAGLSNILCNDNGTPSDPSDDYITFELDPTGNNLGTSYTVSGTNLSPTGGNYGNTTTFQTDPGTAGAGDLNLTITDGDDANCTLSFTVTDPGTCSPECGLTNSGLTNIQCNDNGTPSNPTDDYITFDLNPTGNNLGTSYTVSGTNLSPSGGNYGSVTSFQTDPGTAGTGDLNLTITDDSDANCTLSFTVTDPGSCSPNCEITASGLTNIQCNDNGSPSDPSDDYITFDLDPTGFNLGASYTVSGASLSPGSGNYGGITSFQTDPGTAGAGDLNLTITDDGDSGCTFNFTVNDPGTCSPECELLSAGLSNVQCHNNGTPSDPTDDYITFDLNPSGNNLGTSYTVSGTSLLPAGGNYGVTTSFQTDPGTAGAGNLNLTITDSGDANCTFNFTVTDPGTCSPDCEIITSGLTNIQCNDNGTPSDPTDDYITFELDPTGFNLGADYSVSGTNISPAFANYGSATTFQTDPGTAGAGDLNLSVVDGNDSGCTFPFTLTDPGTCSPECGLLTSGLSNIQCNDNGTPSDPTDDYITFDLDPTGNNLGTTYNVTGINLTPSTGVYGGITSFQTDPGTAGAGNLNLTITDDSDANCTLSFSVTDPGTCSPECGLLTSGLSNIQCNDNGTPSDPTDDYITFDLDPTGNNIGNSYSVSGANLSPSGGNYGGVTSFQTDPGTAGAGDLNLTITDDSDANCTLNFTVTDPGTCSPNCIILTSGLTNIQCNDNGTPGDPTDDYITFSLDPTGFNLGASYSVSGTNITPASANYGSPTNFQTDPGTAGAGNLNLSIDDSDDSGCTLGITVNDPGTCSNNCSITSAGLSNIQCNDNGTPSDPTDDYITFDLNPTGNNVSTNYIVTGANLTPSSAPFGVVTNFQTDPGTAGAGDLNLTISDENNSACSISVTVTDPGSCSPTCGIIASGLGNVQCNDNGTPTNPNDDYITFELDPTGFNLGTTYTVTGINLTPSTGVYGGITVFQTDPGTAGAGNLNLTITDDSDANCTFSLIIIDPGSCSPICDITDAGLTNVQCNDNGTPSFPFDDYITFDLDPAGFNLGFTYLVSGANVSPNSGNYGLVTSFETTPGTAGIGNLNLTLTDDSDAACTFSFTVNDPGNCSPECEITDVNLANVQCNDNGTPSDPSDDYITFTLNPTGNNLGTGYSFSGANITPSQGNYGPLTLFQSDPGTAGAGDLNLTIIDNSDAGCTFSFTVIDPGSCSNNCEIFTSGLSNIQCNDNGTFSDPTDDYITFELDPTGLNLGNSYLVSGTNLTPSSANYGMITTFQTDPGTAGDGDLNLTITDGNNSGCTFNFTVQDPGPCSNNCEITDAGLANILCDDNQTPADPSDDIIIFDLDPTGVNLGSDYVITGGNIIPPGGFYGGVTTFQTVAGDAGMGDLELMLIDGSSSGCTFEFTVLDPGTCSNQCQIDDEGLTNIQCNNNGTPSDPSDDYITFELDPTGFNLGNNYTVSGTNFTPASGNYGASTFFQSDPGSAGAGDLTLTITDSNDANCTLTFNVSDPGSCSNSCDISASGLSNVQCNDNGTPGDDTDDYITFELDPSGINLGTSYSVSGTSLTPSGGNYGTPTTFQTDPGTAGDGDLNLTITDVNNSNCTFNFIVFDPGTCSNDCEILDSGISNVQCNDNGTPSNQNDDYITFDLEPTGNNLGSGYTVDGATVTPNGGNYGNITSFQTEPGSVGSGDFELTIIDNNNSGCTLNFTIMDPGSCSNACSLTSTGFGSLECNDNGTPYYTEDDYFSFDLNPTGSNLSPNGYEVSGTVAISPASANYFAVTNFSTDIGTVGNGNLNIVITDADDVNCNLAFTLFDPSPSPILVNTMDPDSCQGDGQITIGGLDANSGYNVIYDNLPDTNIVVGPIAANANGEITFNVPSGEYSDIRIQDIVTLCIGGSLTANLADPDAPGLTEASNDASCPNESDGSIDLTVTGGSPGYTFDWDNDGTGDNDDPEDLTDLPAGTYQVTVTDAGNCSATLSTTIDDADNTPPIALCQDITVEVDTAGVVSIIPSAIDGGSSDNCSTVSLSIDNDSFNCDSVGVNIVLLSVEDDAGNVNTCPANVTVEDNIAPNAMCSGITVEIGVTGIASITPAQINDGSTDNCGNISLSLDQSTFTCNDIGTQPVILTVDDGNGNSSDCAAPVNVEDNIFPVASCQNIIVTIGQSGIATILPTDIDGGSSDNCGLLTYQISQDTFNCDNIGVNIVILTIEDSDGNTDQCNATVTVSENINPVAICQDFAASLDADGSANILPEDINNGSSDNCEILSLSLNQDTFSCDDIGSNIVTLSVEDINGNIGECDATITIVDDFPPVAICQDITVQLNPNDTVQIVATQVNNGSEDNCDSVNLAIDLDSFDCNNVGPNNVILTVSDDNGNTESCTAVVTIIETVLPNALCQDITIMLDGTGNATIVPSDIDNGSSDNCGTVNLSLDIDSFDCDDVGINTITLTVSDISGNADTCIALVDVEKSNVPVVVCQNISVWLDQDGNASIVPEDIDGGSSDNCGAVNFFINQSTFNCNDLGTNNVILTGDDGIGNINQCTAVVTVLDSIPPELDCLNITASLGVNNSITIAPQIIELFSNDNCGNVTLSLDNDTFNCDDLGPNTVTLFAEDSSGNMTPCQSVITVTENIPPMAICQNITVELDNDGLATITPAQIDNGSNDNCGIITLNISIDSFDCDDIGANTISLIVNDGSGNSAQCNGLVTIEDNTPSIVMTQDITVDLDGDGMIEITADMIQAGSTDNCGIANIEIDINEFNCDDIGPNQVILTLTDIHGNISSDTATVTVEDNVLPMVITQNINVFLDGNGMVSITAQDIDNGSTDNCGIDSISIDIQDFDCSDVGDNFVNLEVTDVNGNVNNSIATVSVLDTIPPVITCPQDNEILTIDCANTITYQMPNIDDNCANDNFVLIQGLPSGAQFPAGPTLNTWEYTDLGGNSIQCSFTITAPAPINISNVQIDSLLCFGDSTGQISVTAEDGLQPYAYSWNTGNVTSSISDLPAGMYEVTVTDSLGCEVTESFELLDPNMIEIMVDQITNDTNMMSKGAIEITVMGGAGNYNFDWYLNNILISQDEDPMNLAAGDYLVEVTDENGCIISSNIITVDGINNVNEPGWASQLSLNPNPTTGRLFLSIPNLYAEVQVEVFDIVGQKIQLDIQEMSQNNFELNLEAVPSGVYLVQISAYGDRISRKVVVER